MPDTLASLRGPVSCRRGAAPLGLTLVGETSEHPGERTELAFSAAAPADFPEALEGAVIERVGTHQYRSEERRVGKECRTRRRTDDEQTKEKIARETTVR